MALHFYWIIIKWRKSAINRFEYYQYRYYNFGNALLENYWKVHKNGIFICSESEKCFYVYYNSDAMKDFLLFTLQTKEFKCL